MKCETRILQNGIDIQNLMNVSRENGNYKVKPPYNIVSFRGFTDLYRLHEILVKRNASNKYSVANLSFIYPFFDATYIEKCSY